MNTQEDGGPAFPNSKEEAREDWGPSSGMSLRDWFATHSPQPSGTDIQDVIARARIRNPYNDKKLPAVSELDAECQLRYKWADAMLKAREQ